MRKRPFAFLLALAGLWAVLLLPAVSIASPTSQDGKPSQLFRIPFGTNQFDLRTNAGLEELNKALKQLILTSDKEFAEREGTRLVMLHTNPLSEMTPRSLRNWYREEEGWLGKKERRALRALQRITESTLAEDDSDSKEGRLRQLLEIACALNNLQKAPIPTHVDFVQAPFFVWKYYYAPIGKGTRPALNLQRRSQNQDLSKADPPNSTFWVKPEALERQDLFMGFGRAASPNFEEPIWVYHSPKTGFGTSPGFEVQSGNRKLKVKFAETRSEPFAARIFAALGYHVQPTDHVPQLKIRYDRRLFLEFNLRKEVSTKVSTFLVPSYTIRIQERFDPFDFICAAVLKNGNRLSGAELKERLLHNPTMTGPNECPANFNSALEDRIDYLVTAPANVHSVPKRSRSVGVWDFDQLGHADLRELRGMAVLSAWLGWFDCRVLNMRLEVMETEGGLELRHAIDDLGSCLGNASGLTSRRCELPDEFAWSFTRGPKIQGRGRMTIPFRIVGYRPIETPEAFKRMTIDDARWMARWIGRLSESQIRDALESARFESRYVKIYLEKLMSRRNRLIQDLGLTAPLLSESDR